MTTHPTTTSTPPPQHWRWGARGAFTLDAPRVVAIINATPDSFYAGSRASGPDAALHAAAEAAQAGADMLDIGGESTRPGAERIPEHEQIRRVVPLIRALRDAGDQRLSEIPLSIDTTLPGVARAALDAGADAINDVSAGLEGGPEMLRLAAERGAGLILMHRLAPPDRDSFSDRYERPPAYADVVLAVRDALLKRARAAEAAGVDRDRILLDPGLGFGKSVEQNLDLVARTGELVAAGYPVLSAASRKSFVGRVSLPEREQSAPEDRLPGSLAFSVTHLLAGAKIFRVHDPGPHRAALLAAWAILRRGT